ncbi:MAG: two-component sensor histidine kinase [Aquimarina sp.]|nr:two-component sensor histidine kinase [Aquimarina sp.]
MNTTAKLLRDNVLEIMELWQNKVKIDVSAARDANAIALFDHLPNIINDIADIMDRYEDIKDIDTDKKYLEIIENSLHHGRNRAASTNYTVEQVVHEYIIFSRILSTYIHDHNIYDPKTSDLLKYVIDTAILKSVSAFSRSIQEMQEKLVGTIAHDIRNPLSAAKLSLEMIEQDKSGNYTEKAGIAAKKSVEKALNLIEGLMNGITVKAGEGMMLSFSKTDILKDIEWVVEESKNVYTNPIILHSNAKEITGIFDGTAIRRLLENLIGNAVKYGLSSKEITVAVRNDEETVEIEIHNFGNPIPKEKQKHIFQFMNSENSDAKSVAGSWGMGLTLAQIVTEAHGGDIDLTSDEENGTSFNITLIKYANEIGNRRAKLNFAT